MVQPHPDHGTDRGVSRAVFARRLVPFVLIALAVLTIAAFVFAQPSVAVSSLMP